MKPKNRKRAKEAAQSWDNSAIVQIQVSNPEFIIFRYTHNYAPVGIFDTSTKKFTVNVTEVLIPAPEV